MDLEQEVKIKIKLSFKVEIFKKKRIFFYNIKTSLHISKDQYDNNFSFPPTISYFKYDFINLKL